MTQSIAIVFAHIALLTFGITNTVVGQPTCQSNVPLGTVQLVTNSDYSSTPTPYYYNLYSTDAPFIYNKNSTSTSPVPRPPPPPSTPPPKRYPQIYVPLFVTNIEIAKLKNGAVTEKVAFDSNVLNDQSRTTKYRNSYGGGYYVVNIVEMNVDTATDSFVACLQMNEIKNDQPTPCRLCKFITPSCPYLYNSLTGYAPCSSRFFSVETALINTNKGTASFSFYDLPTPTMILEGELVGRSSSSSYSSGSYSCNASVPIKMKPTKIYSNTILAFDFDNLQSNYYYTLKPTFSVVWNDTTATPFNWPTTMPINWDSSMYIPNMSTGSGCY